jgi:hypothetical protein
MLLVPVPWARGLWALPFSSVLAPSERYFAKRGKRHKKITDWARQMLLQLRRWWPEREIVAVADSAYASLRLLASCQRLLARAVTFITRLRLDAALYDPAPPRRAGQIGRPRLKGERLPHLSLVAEDPRPPFGHPPTWRTGTAAQSAPCGGSLGDRGVWYTARGIARRARLRQLGIGARSQRRVRYPGLAVHRPWCQARADRGVVYLAVGRWRRPSRKHLDTWAWKRKGSGRS